MLIPFTKYQALGNSFIVLDRIHHRGRLKRFEQLAIDICDRTRGVGADGLLIISGRDEPYRVDIYNADGSWAEKSGNGVRIAAMHLRNRGLVDGRTCRMRTGSGDSHIRFFSGSSRQLGISASLGKAVFEAWKIPVDTSEKYFIDQRIVCDGVPHSVSAVSVGNPHLVLFCNDFDFDWKALGAKLETDTLFPHRINVGFVVVRDSRHIEVRDWERGVGPTLSSGTGAAAAVVIAAVRQFTERRVSVTTLAGTLDVEWGEADDEITIKGPVTFVCEGQYDRRLS
jgi:diaminopimelate epimerase